MTPIRRMNSSVEAPNLRIIKNMRESFAKLTPYVKIFLMLTIFSLCTTPVASNRYAMRSELKTR